MIIRADREGTENFVVLNLKKAESIETLLDVQLAVAEEVEVFYAEGERPKTAREILSLLEDEQITVSVLRDGLMKTLKQATKAFAPPKFNWREQYMAALRAAARQGSK
jgi:hypothetical protein